MIDAMARLHKSMAGRAMGRFLRFGMLRGLRSVEIDPEDFRRTLAEKHGLWVPHFGRMKDAPLGKTIYNVFEAVVEPFLVQPTIIYDFPTAVSPLSKQKPDHPEWVERFEFFIGGFEIGNAFSELNDPVEQHKRL